MQDKDTQALYQTKFGRNYLMQIQLENDLQINNNTFTIENSSTLNFVSFQYPRTCEFSINRTTTSSTNTGEFTFYNVPLELRNKLNKALYQSEIYRKVIFQAGYGVNLSTIFIGNITQCYSYKEGADIVTKLNANDGAYAAYTGFSQKTFKGGASFQYLYETIIEDMPNLKKGYVTPIVDDVVSASGNDTTYRSSSIVGNSFALLKTLTNNQIFIDLETIHVMSAQEVFENSMLPLISSETGLLGTPMIQGSCLELEMLFEPKITIAQLVEVQSTIVPQFNGQYKVQGISHNGIISGSHNGECKTKLYLTLNNPQNPYQIVDYTI